MLSSDIRSGFLEFFRRHGHQVVESSSLVPQNDPSLLFTNAGMVQFKNVFTGLETRNYTRATTSQKCLRAGGKHNDLDQIGFTARHHTFFEMLGNFSFGDYFKEDAIHFAWTFLTKELGLPRSKLLATVYHTDEEARSIWKKVAGDIAIIPITTSDNFWSMGDTGPCGPCSEIFYDHGEGVFGGMPGTPDQDGDRYMEIWNIVFMQFEQRQDGEKIPLGKKSIDTGMGLERISGVMQGVPDNYQIDLFRPIIGKIKTISQTNFEDTHPSYKVIADHIRSISFLIADGILPTNEGRGYVLRRILRRAMRHGNLMGIRDPFLFKLSDSFVDSMKDSYPELEKARATIAFTIHMEEEKFLTTLDRGLKILRNDIKKIPSGGVLGGEQAFKLYDTYGFPLDLTQDILKSESIGVDVAGFDAALQEQKNRAKWSGSGEVKEDKIWLNLKEKIKSVEFTGYEKEKESGKILAMVQDGNEVSSVSSGKAFLVTQSTPFYAECGGQCGDVGLIKGKTGVFKVVGTRRFCEDIIVHEGEIVSGYLQNSDDVEMEIDGAKRLKIQANHTATHLLHGALRRVLGEHVVQRGSFLNDERLRFDFSQDSAISAENILKIEKMVNDWILRDLKVDCKIVSKSEAVSSGAMALFGEKYGNSVRMVSVFDETKGKISSELCGGTHVSSTGKIGLFKILSEASIGSGIRRIEAITGEKILEHLTQTEKLVDSLAEKLKCGISDLATKIDDLLAELKQRNQEISLQRQKTAMEEIRKISKASATVYSLVVSDHEPDELRGLHDVLRSKNPSGIIVVASRGGDKVSLIVGVSSDLQSKYNAVHLLGRALDFLNGKGGGNVAFARGGGNGGSKIDEAVQLIVDAVG